MPSLVDTKSARGPRSPMEDRREIEQLSKCSFSPSWLPATWVIMGTTVSRWHAIHTKLLRQSRRSLFKYRVIVSSSTVSGWGIVQTELFFQSPLFLVSTLTQLLPFKLQSICPLEKLINNRKFKQNISLSILAVGLNSKSFCSKGEENGILLFILNQVVMSKLISNIKTIK